MTKSEKVKLGIAGGAFGLTLLIVLFWYVILAEPKPTPPEPLPEGTKAPSSRTPGKPR